MRTIACALMLSAYLLVTPPALANPPAQPVPIVLVLDPPRRREGGLRRRPGDPPRFVRPVVR